MEVKWSAAGDVTLKIRNLFRDDFSATVASGGVISAKLYSFLLLLRAKLPWDSQEVEGLNSVVQRIGDHAPNISIALASDRLRNKMAQRAPTPEECAAMHRAVLETRDSKFSVQRFQLGADVLPAPRDANLRVDRAECGGYLGDTNGT